MVQCSRGNAEVTFNSTGIPQETFTRWLRLGGSRHRLGCCESYEMPSISQDPILSTTLDAAGKPFFFPSGLGQVDATLFEIPPGTVLPVHKHPAPRMGYILSGTLRVTNVETGETTTYTAGNFAIEAVDVWHEGENVGGGPVRLLVIDLVEPGASNVVLR